MSIQMSPGEESVRVVHGAEAGEHGCVYELVEPLPAGGHGLLALMNRPPNMKKSDMKRPLRMLERDLRRTQRHPQLRQERCTPAPARTPPGRNLKNSVPLLHEAHHEVERHDEEDASAKKMYGSSTTRHGRGCTSRIVVHAHGRLAVVHGALAEERREGGGGRHGGRERDAEEDDGEERVDARERAGLVDLQVDQPQQHARCTSIRMTRDRLVGDVAVVHDEVALLHLLVARRTSRCTAGSRTTARWRPRPRCRGRDRKLVSLQPPPRAWLAFLPDGVPVLPPRSPARRWPRPRHCALRPR